MKKLLRGILIILGIGILYLLFFPISMEPVAFTPPTRPAMAGPFAPNQKLGNIEKILEQLDEMGPEDITWGPDSLFYSGFANGKIYRFSADGQYTDLFAETEGRPLGLKFDKAGNLIVVDEHKGLISIDKGGKISTLATEVEGTKIEYADHLDISEEGIIYFSDATTRNHNVITEAWEAQASGRLISYNPNTKETKIVLDSLRFANGVALGPNEDYVLVVETMGMVVNKYWLKGPKKGQREHWANELPGFPDNISYNGKGTFWLALPNLRTDPAVEALLEKPFLRKVIARLPRSILESQEPRPYGMVLGFDLNGKVIHNLQDTTGAFYYITSANEFDGTLYLGSLRTNCIGKYDLQSTK